MKRIALLATGWVFGILTASGVAVASHGVDVFGLLQAAHREAAVIDEIAIGLRDESARRRIHASVLRLQGQIVAVHQALEVPPPPPPLPEPEPIPVVTDTEVHQMKTALDGAAFSADKLRLLDDLRRDRWFTSAQVKSIVAAFSFSTDRVEAAARLYPHVVDQDQFWIVIESMTFSSDKEKLRRRIGR